MSLQTILSVSNLGSLESASVIIVHNCVSPSEQYVEINFSAVTFESNVNTKVSVLCDTCEFSTVTSQVELALEQLFSDHLYDYEDQLQAIITLYNVIV